MANIDQALHESALLAWRLAPQLCPMGSSVRQFCSAMHGVWQWLRLLGLVDAIDRRAEFYDRATALIAAKNRAPRILICGAADYAMLEQVTTSSRRHHIRPGVTVIDVCATPLAVNRWFAERYGLLIRTAQQDVMALAESGSYDAIVTDAFLGRFSPQQRSALIAKWRNLLAPGGRVVTASRLRPGRMGEEVAFNAGQSQVLRDTVFARASEMNEALRVDPRAVADLAVQYARHHTSYAVSSLRELGDLFESGGLRIENLTTLPLRAGPDVDLGPSLRKAGEYGGVVATRN